MSIIGGHWQRNTYSFKNDEIVNAIVSFSHLLFLNFFFLIPEKLLQTICISFSIENTNFLQRTAVLFVASVNFSSARFLIWKCSNYLELVIVIYTIWLQTAFSNLFLTIFNLSLEFHAKSQQMPDLYLRLLLTFCNLI